MVSSISYGAAGLAGWRVLQRTEMRQIEALAQQPAVQRATQHFADRAGSEMTATELVDDYQMLSVVLGAFGLEADQRNRAFIEKVLSSDLEDPQSFAHRLSDKRYLKLAEAYQQGIAAGDAGVVENVIQSYVHHQFELQVGEGDDSLRLALNARRELQAMADRTSTNKTLWYEVLGNAPLRKVFETAFGFGSAYGQLSIDRQLEEFSAAAERFLGTAELVEIAAGEGIERLVTMFLVRGQVTTESQNRYSTALALLTGG